jgi:hypothetical protein
VNKAQLRERQLQAVAAILAEKPGLTAFQVGFHIPVEHPARSEILASSAPLTLVLSLLCELEKQGRVRAELNPKGALWYPAEEQ